MGYEKIVIKLTGYLFETWDGLGQLKRIADFINSVVGEKVDRVMIIVGGGGKLRSIVEFLRNCGASEALLDMIGITQTRVNALIMSSLMGREVNKFIPKSIEEFNEIFNQYKVIVMGGLTPGFSTNAVAALIAELIEANLLIMMTRAGALYDKDPERFPEAKKIKEVSVRKLREILSRYIEKAAYYPLMDHLSINIIERSKITTFIIPPTIDALKKALVGECVGTVIKPASI